MTAQSCIEELAREKLLGRRPKCVSFVDALLQLAQEVGEIQCTRATEDRLRFLIPAQPPAFEVEVDAAVSKLRMMCARLGVLCNESGDQDVSLYGGEGVIEKAPTSSSNPLVDGMRNSYQAGDLPGEASVAVDVSSPAPDTDRMTWKVRFQNTPSAHEFTIQKT